MSKNSFLSKEGQDKKLVWIPWLFVLIFFGMALVSRLVYQPSLNRFDIRPPSLVSGDEPHYLMVANSLLFDRDLQLQEDYQRVRRGGLEAGKRFQWRRLDHHTFLFDPRTGESSLWGKIFDPRTLEPCETVDCVGFYRKSPRFSDLSSILERSSHPVAFPAILAAILAPTFPSLPQVEERASWIIVGLSWITLLIAYAIARRAGLNPPASVCAVLLLILASPWLAYSQSYFSEPLIGFLLAVGLLAMQRNGIILASLMVILAMAVKPPFALIGLGWIIERLAARRFRPALTMALVVLLGGLALMAFNYWQAGVAIVGGNSSFEKMWKFPNPLPTLLNHQYGLFLFVPWALVAWAGMFLALKGEPSEQNVLLRQIALPSLFFWILLSFYVHLGGSAYGPRFWVPFLPWFALATMITAVHWSRPFRRVVGALALAGLLVAVPGALIYPFNWDRPPHYSLRQWVSGIIR